MLAYEALGHLSKLRHVAVKVDRGLEHLDAAMEIVRQLAVGPED